MNLAVSTREKSHNAQIGVLPQSDCKITNYSSNLLYVSYFIVLILSYGFFCLLYIIRTCTIPNRKGSVFMIELIEEQVFNIFGFLVSSTLENIHMATVIVHILIGLLTV